MAVLKSLSSGSYICVISMLTCIYCLFFQFEILQSLGTMRQFFVFCCFFFNQEPDILWGFFVFVFCLFRLYLFIYERHRERKAETQAEGEADSLPGTQ